MRSSMARPGALPEKRIAFGPRIRFIRHCINDEEDVWAVRVTLRYRAVGVLQGDTVTWFWIGSHDDYERFFG